MKTTRKRYSADFKAKVALEAIRGDLTLAELVAKHGVHHTMIACWKRQAIDGMAGTFSGAGDAAKVASESEVEKLHAKAWQVNESVLRQQMRGGIARIDITSEGLEHAARNLNSFTAREIRFIESNLDQYGYVLR